MKHPCRHCGVDTRTKYLQVCSHCLSVRAFLVDIGSGKMRAGSAVASAVKRRTLQRPSEYFCSCGQKAAQYDHRDYNKPLDVEPICRRCNIRRGSAIPKNWTVDEWKQYVRSLLKNPVCRRPYLRHASKIVFPVSFGVAPPKSAKRIAHRRDSLKNLSAASHS